MVRVSVRVGQGRGRVRRLRGGLEVDAGDLVEGSEERAEAEAAVGGGWQVEATPKALDAECVFTEVVRVRDRVRVMVRVRLPLRCCTPSVSSPRWTCSPYP